MDLLIVKNGHVYARANDEEYVSTDIYELRTESAPAYPSEPAGRGKFWDLDYVNGVLTWVAKCRELTTEERLDTIEEDVREQKYIWKVGDAVNIGDERFYKNIWYVCLQAHTTQIGWEPDIAVSLWRAK